MDKVPLLLASLPGVPRLSAADRPFPERVGWCYVFSMLAIAGALPPDRAFLAYLCREFGYKSLFLVHGFPRMSRDVGEQIMGVPKGYRYGHAWIECSGSDRFGDAAFDPVLFGAMDVSTFYRVGSIEADKVHRYDEPTATLMFQRHGGEGPWHGYDSDEPVWWVDDRPEVRGKRVSRDFARRYYEKHGVTDET